MSRNSSVSPMYFAEHVRNMAERRRYAALKSEPIEAVTYVSQD